MLEGSGTRTRVRFSRAGSGAECSILSSRYHTPQSLIGSRSNNRLMCAGIPNTTGFSKILLILL